MSRSAGTRTSSKCRVNCRSGRVTDTGSGSLTSPGASVSHHEQRQRGTAVGAGRAGPGDDEDGVGVVDAGDVVLLPAQHVVASPSRAAVVASRWLLDPASGSVIAKTILLVPLARPGSQRARCSGDAVGGDDLTGDGAGDEQQEQRGPVGRRLLADDGELGQPGAAPAVLLGQVDAEEAVVAEGVPQLGGRLAGLGLADVVVGAELLGDGTHRLAQGPVLVGLGEVHAGSRGQGAVAVWVSAARTGWGGRGAGRPAGRPAESAGTPPGPWPAGRGGSRRRRPCPSSPTMTKLSARRFGSS